MMQRRESARLSTPQTALITVAVLSVAYVIGSLVGWGGHTAASWVSSWAGVVASGAAMLGLLNAWRGATGTVRTVRLALAAGCAAWCAGELVQAFSRFVLSRAATSLSFSDLFLIVALVPVGLSFAYGARRPRRIGPIVRYLLDTYACSAALFAVGWALLFAHLYRASGEPAGAFLFELIYPIVDIVLLCGAVPLVLVTPRSRRPPAIAVYAAVLALTVADVVETTIHIGGGVSGDLAHAPRIIAYLLVGVVPWLAKPAPRPAGEPHRAAELPPLLSNAMPGLAAILAVLVLAVRSITGDGRVEPVLAAATASAVIVAAIRMFGVAAEVVRLRRTAQAGEDHFQALAESIGDVVVISDLDGVIRYASAGVSETYGYARDALFGRNVSEIVHPEDWPGLRLKLSRFLRSGDETVVVQGRVLAADGTWLHTESTISRYHRPGERHGLLITTRDMSDQVALQQQVTHLTFHDGLTGLPNRAYYEERVREVLTRDRDASGCVCVFIDLDGFTAVNDSAGHAAGDLLLSQAARRLRAAVPIDDTVARWGGDEFAVFVESPADAQTVVDLADRLLSSVAAEPFRVAGSDITLTASIGVAFAEDRLEASELIRNADVAMARAKELGGGRVEIFAAHMHADVVRRLELVNDLRRALDEDKFAIEYQPVVELATSRVTGVEALVRLRRGRTYVGADEFIRPAEESGLIVPLGAWVLREACAQVARWRASSWDIGLSVNLAARQIAAPQFVETVAGALEDSGLPGEALTVEVTEETLVDDTGQALDRLRELRDLGVRLAIDDFGTGYASLVYLRQLPVDIIKIDPSFVSGLGRDETVSLLTRTIVRLGRDLGIAVVAEGIERPDQLDLLREMGCARGQGYLVARPMIAQRVEKLIRPPRAKGSAVPTR